MKFLPDAKLAFKLLGRGLVDNSNYSKHFRLLLPGLQREEGEACAAVMTACSAARSGQQLTHSVYDDVSVSYPIREEDMIILARSQSRGGHDRTAGRRRG
jgi:hypothetical protein